MGRENDVNRYCVCTFSNLKINKIHFYHNFSKMDERFHHPLTEIERTNAVVGLDVCPFKLAVEHHEKEVEKKAKRHRENQMKEYAHVQESWSKTHVDERYLTEQMDYLHDQQLTVLSTENVAWKYSKAKATLGVDRAKKWQEEKDGYDDSMANFKEREILKNKQEDYQRARMQCFFWNHEVHDHEAEALDDTWEGRNDLWQQRMDLRSGIEEKDILISNLEREVRKAEALQKTLGEDLKRARDERVKMSKSKNKAIISLNKQLKTLTGQKEAVEARVNEMEKQGKEFWEMCDLSLNSVSPEESNKRKSYT